MNSSKLRRIPVIDSHTGGEPTRVVLSGGPDLGGGTVEEQMVVFKNEHDAFRSAIVNEPRGSGVLVGALICPSVDPTCAAGVIFFNNVGCLGMCGHGIIGLVISLVHLGRLTVPGAVRIETPVGVVEATWLGGNEVSLTNVPSFRRAANVALKVPGLGTVTGDVAWGGNWFFLVKQTAEPLQLSNLEALTNLAWRIRHAANSQGYPEVDHVELFAPGLSGGDSRNFVLCPGGEYDRSPCGTGTSAKLACLAADGVLAEGAQWIQESIVGSRFTGSYTWLDRARGVVTPVVCGSAFIQAEATLLLDAADPFCWGIQ